MQIKSHAQKVLKRIDVGEDVFRRLEENRDRLRVLIHEANDVIRNKESMNQGSKKKRKRATTRKSDACSASYSTIDWDNIQDVDVELAMDIAIRRPKDAPFVSPGSVAARRRCRIKASSDSSFSSFSRRSFS